MLEKIMTLRLLSLAFAALLAAFPSFAAAQQAEDSTLVSLFLQTCTRGEVNADAILAGVSDAGDWIEIPNPTVNVRALAQVPSQTVLRGAFPQPESVRQWQRTWNGRQVTLAFATFPERNAHRYVCMILVPDIRNAIPYLTAMREGMRSIGLSARSTDLPHYQEYAGRLSDRRRARADIFSRSQAVTERNTMHLYIAFEQAPPP
jgi:hypothetical protein